MYKNNRRNIKLRKDSKLKKIILNHIELNIKEYIIVLLIFLIGIIIGVIFINNVDEDQSNEIVEHINNSIINLKNNNEINNFAYLKESIKNNILLAVFLWFMGSTVIGISIVYLTICFRGFCLGYTISSITLSLGVRKGLDFYIFVFSNSKSIVYTMFVFNYSKLHETS